MKRGPRSVRRGEKELLEKLGITTLARVDRAGASRSAVETAAAFDGVMGDHNYRES